MAASLEQRERDLLAHTRELEDARRETEDASRAAESANRAKSEFLSRMSHELRTPMHVIIGFSQLLEGDSLDEAQRKRVAHILKSSRHLLELINEVLDISKIDAGALTLSPEPVAVGAAMQDVAALCESLAAQSGIDLRVQAGPAEALYATADAQRLRQVLLNLVSNAIKYNREGGEVELSARSEDCRVTIRVRDTGRFGAVGRDAVGAPGWGSRCPGG